AAPARTKHGPDDEMPVARGVHVDSPLARAEEPPARPLGAVGLAGCKMNRMTVGRPQVEPKGTQALRQRRASIKPSDHQVHCVIASFGDLKQWTRTVSKCDRIGWRSRRQPRSGRRFPRHHRVQDYLDPPGAAGTRLDGEPVFPRLQFMLDQGDGYTGPPGGSRVQAVPDAGAA